MLDWFRRLRKADAFRIQPREMASADYAAINGGRWTVVHAAREREPTEAHRFGDLVADYESKLDHRIPELGGIDSPALLVAGEAGTIIASDGTVLTDHSWFRGYFNQMPIDATPLEIRRLGGSAVALTSEWASHSYGHFIQDLLPRLAILREVAPLASFDHIFTYAPSEMCFGMLARLGVNLDKVVRPARGVALTADRVAAVSFPSARRCIEPWAVEFIRSSFRSGAPLPNRRLYILRTSRKPINEAALLRMLQPHGFEIYSPERDEAGEAAAFEAAEIVIAPAGSALANLVFCKPGTKVLELVPSDHVFPYNYSIARFGGLNYSYIVGESTGRRANDTIGPSPFDFRVDEAVFAEALAELLRT